WGAERGGVGAGDGLDGAREGAVPRVPRPPAPHAGVRRRPPRPAVLLRHIGQQQPELTGLEPDLSIHMVLRAKPQVVRLQVLLAESPHGVGELVEVLGHPRRVMLEHARLPRRQRLPKPPPQTTTWPET